MSVPAHVLDLNFQGRSHAIASYLIRHPDGAVLIESGPGSTKQALQARLAEHGLTTRDVTHVLLTHIHLDHAGAAGWLARQGALIHVHPVGAPHLLSPERLLASAARIYGDQMETLWGEFLAVPAERLIVLRDGEEVAVGPLRFTAVDTPGHAEHHYAYLFEDMCFSGDVGGVRIPGFSYLRPPMPPPELNLERWHASIERLRALKFRRIAPTHFGIYSDPQWQLSTLERALNDVSTWLEEVMPAAPDIGDLRARFTAWMDDQAQAAGLTPDALAAYALANPLGMSADGLQRYWQKFRAQQPGKP
jgi:glyoxylase-like metal-dependent hydrolase (beta-lactamase superfamily II)